MWSIGVFDNGFRDAPVRTLNNTTLRRFRAAGSPSPGTRPGEGELVGAASNGAPIVRYDTAPPSTDVSGDLEAMANYAGQSVGVIKRWQPAADIVREVSEEAERILVAFSP